jgi:type II secretory pathway component PulM
MYFDVRVAIDVLIMALWAQEKKVGVPLESYLRGEKPRHRSLLAGLGYPPMNAVVNARYEFP